MNLKTESWINWTTEWANWNDAILEIEDPFNEQDEIEEWIERLQRELTEEHQNG